MNPYVKSVQALDDYQLTLVFENGEERLFDMKPYLEMGVFRRSKDLALFRTAREVSGSVEWNGEVDLSYDTLYIESRVVERSDAARAG